VGLPKKPNYDLDDRAAAMFLEVAVQFGPESGSDFVSEPGSDRGVAGAPPVADAGYKIIEEIGEGGMGTVWRAQQLGTGQMVALKALKRNLLQQPGTIARFHTEVRLAASLKHPNIARVFDSGLDRLDYFYVMELVDGQSIDEYVAGMGRTPREIVELMVDVADAVSYAHARDVVHLDLKPSNILVSEEGRPYILDFGLARIVGQADHHAAYRAGTRGYVAPEQMIFGESLDQRADVFAIGRILQRLLESAPSQSGTPQADDLQAIIRRATADDRNHRYPTADDLTDDLRNWLALRPVTAQPRTLRYTSSLWAKRNKRSLTLSILLAILLVLVTSGIGLAVMQREVITQQLSIQSEETFYRSTLRSARERLNQGDVQASQRLLLEADPSSRGWEWRHLASLADQSSHTVMFKGDLIRDFTLMGSNQLACLTLSGEVRYITLANSDWTETGLSKGITLPMAISPDAGFVIGQNREGQGVLQSLGPTERLDPTILADSPTIYTKVSPDGRYVLVGTNDGELLLFDTKQNAVIHREAGPKGTIIACFGGDGRSLVWYDEGYRVLDLETLTTSEVAAGILGGHRPRSLAAIGSMLFAGMSDGTVLKCSIGGIAEASVIAHIPTDITTIAVSPDGKTIACGDSDGTIHLIKDANEAQALNGHTSPVTKLVFSDDGDRLYSLSSRGHLKAWDTEWDVTTHQPWPKGNALFYATDSDGRFMAYSSPEAITQLVDTQPGLTEPDSGDRRIAEWWGAPSSLALTHDATRLGIAGNDRALGIHNTTVGAQPKEMMMSTEPAYWLSFGYNETRVAASNSQEVLIWDYEKGEHVRIFETCGPVSWLQSLPGYLAMIRRSPLGYEVEVRDIDHDIQILRESLGVNPIIAMAAASDIDKVATLDSHGRVKVLDVSGRRVVAMIPASDVGAVLTVAMTPDGSRVVTAGDNVVIWSAESGELLDVIEERTEGPLMSIRFTDDGKELVGLGLTGYYKWRTR
jgi:serine/threonine protein kinase/WD40 repeat protein